MEVIIEQDPSAAAERCARIVVHTLETLSKPVLGLATGSSPLPTYQSLIKRHQSGQISFSECTAVLLDEYVGLPPDHPGSYRSFIRSEFVDHIDMPLDRLHGPVTNSSTLEQAGARYDRLIHDLGGVDLQIVGIGSDGHIGFNEPTSSLGSGTRLKTLMDATRRDNARFFDSIDAVPRHVVTQGLATIAAAQHVLMIATGGAKSAPIRAMIEGPVTSMLPASALQFHPHVTVVLDEAAAGQLTHADYFREVYANKPGWQRR